MAALLPRAPDERHRSPPLRRFKSWFDERTVGFG
jgi:hypothetical protein